MINIIYGKKFYKSTQILTPKNREKLLDLILILSENPRDSRLHAKLLSGGLLGLYSFRIIRDWRVVFKFNSAQEIQLLLVGDRKDIYKKLN